MKVWQNPGETGKAEWRCLSDEKDWRERGGVWGKVDPETNESYFVIVLHSTEEWRFEIDHSFYAHAKEVDLAKLTLPEAKDILQGRWGTELLPTPGISVPKELEKALGEDWRWVVLRAAASRGMGLVVGSTGGNTAVFARTEAKRMVDTYLENREIDSALAESRRAHEERVRGDISPVVRTLAMSVHHVRWRRLREKDPVEFMAGFLSGMQRADSQDESEVFQAGWRQGWEYAVGRTPLPEWFVKRQSAYREGG